ncbi:MAG: ATP synthase subunit A [Candidatus Altiarchaeales archaeon]|nr:MAG: ATP synthase subunit A [Candidatus Altiarchaeales archaeon]RLI95084.1 MAG: ATP synthase subunit A [Candidatus Altiarchaeales archaeon]RLI95115.1 MAG: ATP synthase subunit A [Candidatus Altiarchaeales archaeon]HDO82201.1 ATP synthase subunit A [Candidatus Altiarchaeales archaeon]HEX54850.1 ATP synthase subunit A [Candidatus Altiarchaeales archaeon]
MARIIRVAGPLVEADGMRGRQMHEVVMVGDEQLIGEIIRITGDIASIQVYEETTGVKPGEPVIGTGRSLSVELGPGVLKSIYDGIQRPLDLIKKKAGDYISRGITVPAIDKNKKWKFRALVKEGDTLVQGDIVGEIKETKIITNRVMVPPGIKGIVEHIEEGKFRVEDTICILKDGEKEYEIKSMQIWPVRKPRPFKKKLETNVPLITGQRIFDIFFPLAKGGTAAIPGPFGSGKTVSQHQLAKWADADIIVYVGCGERGNEMTEVLDEFPKLQDPKNNLPLMERTCLIANTSNMPVAAREASIYTGITIAEYYRDMGYDTALMADSTSRWAEAMREISARLEEMPGEEGYPAYLASRLAEFYERSGRVICIGSNDRMGSVSIIGAVSPPGGDFSEPVTQNTLRVTQVFWALDAKLADRRHFPAINWLTSYSLYDEDLREWYMKNIGEDFITLKSSAMTILQKESELMEIVQLVGPDALPDRERMVLDVARMIREDFLQQNAFHKVDTYCSLKKQYKMLKIIIKFYEFAVNAIDSGMDPKEIIELDVIDDIAKMKYVPEEKFDEEFDRIIKKIQKYLGG